MFSLSLSLSLSFSCARCFHFLWVLWGLQLRDIFTKGSNIHLVLELCKSDLQVSFMFWLKCRASWCCVWLCGVVVVFNRHLLKCGSALAIPHTKHGQTQGTNRHAHRDTHTQTNTRTHKQTHAHTNTDTDTHTRKYKQTRSFCFCRTTVVGAAIDFQPAITPERVRREGCHAAVASRS